MSDQAPLVKVKLLREAAKVPEYKSAGAAGMDLCACIDCDELTIGSTAVVIGTGIAIELEPGWEAQVRPRGSSPLNGLQVHVGTVDADYRGEVGVIVRAANGHAVIRRGERIAQMIIAPAPQARVEVVDELSDTARGAGAWGSTGKA